jgi:hypothetical protein
MKVGSDDRRAGPVGLRERELVDKRGRDESDERNLLAMAKRGHHESFQQLTEAYRRELQVHCYRMLGSFHDAEDLVQDTLLRAWRAVPSFDGRASVRYWLYRIATNACLNALAARASATRVLPEMHGPPTEPAARYIRRIGHECPPACPRDARRAGCRRMRRQYLQ